MPSAEHYEQVARQLVRAVRGRRSQSDLSRRSGYRSNMVQRWEAGECSPTAANFFDVCRTQRIDLEGALCAFYGRRPEWLPQRWPASNVAVAALLRDHKGKVALSDLAERTGYNRYSLARWLNAQASPRLPQFLHVLDVAGQRMIDFVATLTDPAKLPLLRESWERLNQAREIAYGEPWSHAVLRALEIEEYQRSGWREAGFLAQKLGVSDAVVARALSSLVETGQVQEVHGRFRPSQVLSVNTGRDPQRARQLKATWAKEALRRLQGGGPGLFGYSLFAVGQQDLRRLREIQLEYVRAMEAVVANSSTSECVGLYCVQLMDLDTSAGNALAEAVVPAAQPLA
jgi:transcriptional regulator with XRE-family HTH domain